MSIWSSGISMRLDTWADPGINTRGVLAPSSQKWVSKNNLRYPPPLGSALVGTCFNDLKRKTCHLFAVRAFGIEQKKLITKVNKHPMKMIAIDLILRAFWLRFALRMKQSLISEPRKTNICKAIIY